MSLTILSAGLQTSVQGAPYRGHRGAAIPAAGAADPLALALANRLVGKAADALALEITMSGLTLRADCGIQIALAGAANSLHINDVPRPAHESHIVAAGDVIAVSPPDSGARSYLAVSHDIAVPHLLGSGSTCFSGHFGGLDGRALKDGDIIPLAARDRAVPPLSTPLEMRPVYGKAYLLRYVPGPEHDWLSKAAAKRLHGQTWRASVRMNRMGIALEGASMALIRQDELASSAVFPGTLQCPPDGQPFLLGVDGQTSGGYARIAQIIRADRHLIGQLRAGDTIHFVRTSVPQAQQLYAKKLAFWRPYLPDLRLG